MTEKAFGTLSLQADPGDSSGEKLQRATGADDRTSSRESLSEHALKIIASGGAGYALARMQRTASAGVLGLELATLSLGASLVDSTIHNPGTIGSLGRAVSALVHNETIDKDDLGNVARVGIEGTALFVGAALGAKHSRSNYPRRLAYAGEPMSFMTTERGIPMFSRIETYGARSDVAALLKAKSPSVLEVARQDTRPGYGGVTLHASGFIAEKPDIVATNYHVIQGDVNLSVNTIDGRSVKISQIIGVDVDHDLALLRAEAPLGPPVKVPRKRVISDEPAMLGYPNNERQMHVSVGSHGRMEMQPSLPENERLRREYDDKIAQWSAETQQLLVEGKPVPTSEPTARVPMLTWKMGSIGGYSGSPIFRRSDGRLLGVSARGSDRGPSQASAVPNDFLYALLKREGIV